MTNRIMIHRRESLHPPNKRIQFHSLEKESGKVSINKSNSMSLDTQFDIQRLLTERMELNLNRKGSFLKHYDR